MIQEKINDVKLYVENMQVYFKNERKNEVSFMELATLYRDYEDIFEELGCKISKPVSLEYYEIYSNMKNSKCSMAAFMTLANKLEDNLNEVYNEQV